MVRWKGFEPPTFWFVARHSIQLSYQRTSSKYLPVVEAECLVRSQTLYPAELPAHILLRCSIIISHPAFVVKLFYNII